MRRPRHIRPYGPSALLLEWEARIDAAISRSVHAYAAAVARHPAVTECVPGYASLLVDFLADRTTAYALREYIYAITVSDPVRERADVHLLPVLYGGDAGADLEAVAGQVGLSPEAVIRLHTDREYLVFLLGYQPGFAFLGPTDEGLRVARRSSPRPRVPAGAVGLAERQTGIYPGGSPGGWQLIGRCPWSLLDASGMPRLRPGDRVRFTPVDERTFAELQKAPAWPGR